jgi:hypothetical protein
MKMYLFIVLLSVLIFSIPLSAQHNDSMQDVSAEPFCGWDSLKSQISYPEIFRRAGIWSIYVLNISIDSLGNAKTSGTTRTLHFDRDLNISTDNRFKYADSVFIGKLESLLLSVQWKQMKYDGLPFKGVTKIPIIFNRYGFGNWNGAVVNIPLTITRVVF